MIYPLIFIALEKKKTITLYEFLRPNCHNRDVVKVSMVNAVRCQ